MTRWRGPIIVLCLLLLGGFGITLLNIGRTNIDAIEVELGLQPTTDTTAQVIDDGVLHAISTGALNWELRERLQKPPRTVSLNDFHIDTCEVSQGSYEKFLAWMEERLLQGQGELPPDLLSKSTNDRTAGRENSPASGITQFAAAQYCENVDGRLPLSEELEVAARGLEGRIYPWGNTFEKSAWPFTEADRNSQQACGAHLIASTPTGIHDLANNVMEWTAGTLAPALLSAPELIPVHGAPAVRNRSRELYALSSAWYAISPDVQSHHLGFRCVYDFLPSPILPWGDYMGDTVYISGGEYEVGISAEARVTQFMMKVPEDAEVPLRKLVLSKEQFPARLRVDRCEVSRNEYQRFLNDPLVQAGFYANDKEPAELSHIPLNWKQQLQHPELPVTGISWWSADAFARWSGGRLPTAEEWRAIAAGPRGRKYPWGDSYTPVGIATGDDAGGRLVACDNETDDVTVEGLRHLGANASEWTRSVSIDRGAITMWVQGGNWMLPGERTSQSIFGRKVTVGHRSPSIGFRVVYD